MTVAEGPPLVERVGHGPVRLFVVTVVDADGGLDGRQVRVLDSHLDGVGGDPGARGSSGTGCVVDDELLSATVDVVVVPSAEASSAGLVEHAETASRATNPMVVSFRTDSPDARRGYERR